MIFYNRIKRKLDDRLFIQLQHQNLEYCNHFEQLLLARLASECLFENGKF